MLATATRLDVINNSCFVQTTRRGRYTDYRDTIVNTCHVIHALDCTASLQKQNTHA